MEGGSWISWEVAPSSMLIGQSGCGSGEGAQSLIGDRQLGGAGSHFHRPICLPIRAFGSGTSLFPLDGLAILMIVIILKGQQRFSNAPSVLSHHQLINWKSFSSVCWRPTVGSGFTLEGGNLGCPPASASDPPRPRA